MIYSYEPGQEMLHRLENEFTYHSPNEAQIERYTHLRRIAYGLSVDIVNCTPPSDEQGLALTKLGECVMWANAAIARNE